MASLARKCSEPSLPTPRDERGARACAHHAVGFVLVDDGDGVGAVQLGHGGLHRFKQIALVEAVHQVGDDFGVRLALKT